MQAEAGKGSAPRKAQDKRAFDEGWDRIFGNGKTKDTTTQTAQRIRTSGDEAQSGQASESQKGS